MIPFENVAIIGSGNVAYAYSKALKDNGINPKYVLVRNRETIAEVERLFGVKTIIEYEKLSDCDLIIIAVKDDVIKEVASRLHNYKGVLVHTSGTQSSSVHSITMSDII